LNDDDRRQHGGVVTDGDDYDDKEVGHGNSPLSLLHARKSRGVVRFVSVMIIGMPTTDNDDVKGDNQPSHIVGFNVFIVVLL
jgi:hypothetical protein